jgi:hypothetical protein
MTIPDVVAPARTVHPGLNARLPQARRPEGFMNNGAASAAIPSASVSAKPLMNKIVYQSIGDQERKS